MSKRILTGEELRATKLAGASEGTLQALLNAPDDPLPQPISITTRLRGWDEEEVDAWLERRRLRRDNDVQRKADIAARMPHAGAAAAAAMARRRRADESDVV
jgi:predicted DNA-binding transcriptional regulator AlpA